LGGGDESGRRGQAKRAEAKRAGEEAAFRAPRGRAIPGIMNGFLVVLLILAMVATLGVLFAGLIVMARGGEVNRKYGNVLMRWRVALQFSALVLLALIMLASGK